MRRSCAGSLVLFAAALAGCAASSPPEQRAIYSQQNPEDVAFATATDRRPTAGTLYALANLLASQGREDQVRDVLGRLIRDYPHYVPAYNAMAEHHTRQDRLDDAHEALSAGLAVAPNDKYLLNNMGMLYMLREDYPRALEYFTRASEQEPDDARFRANIAAALGMSGRYGEALGEYKQIMPTPEAHYNVGVLADARGDRERAQNEFREAFRLDPTMQTDGVPNRTWYDE